jgi:hypothetical protein
MFELKFGTETQFMQRPAEEHEGQFVAGTVVNADIGAPRLVDISTELVFGLLDFWRKNGLDEGVSGCAGFGVPVFECRVAVSHGLLDWWGLLEELMKFEEIGGEELEFWVGDGCTDGFTLYGLCRVGSTYWSLWRNWRY